MIVELFLNILIVLVQIGAEVLAILVAVITPILEVIFAVIEVGNVPGLGAGRVPYSEVTSHHATKP